MYTFSASPEPMPELWGSIIFLGYSRKINSTLPSKQTYMINMYILASYYAIYLAMYILTSLLW